VNESINRFESIAKRGSGSAKFEFEKYKMLIGFTPSHHHRFEKVCNGKLVSPKKNEVYKHKTADGQKSYF
jgi:hypothetical protein